MIVSDFLFAKYIAKQSGLKKKIYLFISLLYSLSFLLYFKYSNFFITNFNELLGTNFDLNTVFLPIGISFYTFQSISYLVDISSPESSDKDINFDFSAQYLALITALPSNVFLFSIGSIRLKSFGL